MRKKGILITGAAGEIGDALIRSLAEQGEENIVTLDLRSLVDRKLEAGHSHPGRPDGPRLAGPAGQ